MVIWVVTSIVNVEYLSKFIVTWYRYPFGITFLFSCFIKLIVIITTISKTTSIKKANPNYFVFTTLTSPFLVVILYRISSLRSESYLSFSGVNSINPNSGWQMALSSIFSTFDNLEKAICTTSYCNWLSTIKVVKAAEANTFLFSSYW